MDDYDDATVEVEADDATDHLPPVNSNPQVFYEYFHIVRYTLATYGWFILAAVVVFYFLWKQLSRKASQFLENKATASHKKYDASEVEARQRAIDARIRKLQEEHDLKAAVQAEKQAEIDAKKRQERLEDWERHQQGLGYRSKVKKGEPSEQPATTLPKKKRLRDDDFNPLAGSESPACSWRPGRRGPAAGGG